MGLGVGGKVLGVTESARVGAGETDVWTEVAKGARVWVSSASEMASVGVGAGTSGGAQAWMVNTKKIAPARRSHMCRTELDRDRDCGKCGMSRL